MSEKRILVLLSGCGVYDGAEIHESVFCMLALDQKGLKYQCTAPDDNQHHVVNHLNGEEMEESRNMLVEAARIARGNIRASQDVNMEDYNGLVIPGGFGAAKNFSKWAFDGPHGELHPEAGRLIQQAHTLGKPIVAFCMSPVVIALTLRDISPGVRLTVGSTLAPSPYEIEAIMGGMSTLGVQPEMTEVEGVIVDISNKIITSPCYMMEASIHQVYNGIEKSIEVFAGML
jgi:enhancing lycopene biosynthesis protein 2